MSSQSSKFIDSARTRARSIKGRLKDLGTPVSLAQAYEVLAAANGHRTWAAMRAAEDGTDQNAQADPVETKDNVLTVAVTRRISLDDGDPNADFDPQSLISEAHRDLDYVFMDGEDYLDIRFRDARRVADDEYTVTVDVEMSPRKDFAWHLGRVDLCENVIRYEYTSHSGDTLQPSATADRAAHAR